MPTVLEKIAEILSSDEMFEIRMAVSTRREHLKDLRKDVAKTSPDHLAECDGWIRRFNSTFPEKAFFTDLG
jgi:hypothetical protein